jgi:hypothetical protein
MQTQKLCVSYLVGGRDLGKSVGSKVSERISDCSSAKELLHSAVCASLLRASCCSL